MCASPHRTTPAHMTATQTPPGDAHMLHALFGFTAFPFGFRHYCGTGVCGDCAKKFQRQLQSRLSTSYTSARARDFGQYESQALNVPKNIMAVGRGETAVPVLPRAAKLDGKTTM